MDWSAPLLFDHILAALFRTREGDLAAVEARSQIDLRQLRQELSDMAVNITEVLTTLTQSVSDQTTVVNSTNSFIQGLNTQIETLIEEAKTAGATEAQLAGFIGLQEGIKANTASLVAATVKNTEAASLPVEIAAAETVAAEAEAEAE